VGYARPYCEVDARKREEDGRHDGGNEQQRAVVNDERRPSAGRPKWGQMPVVPVRGTYG